MREVPPGPCDAALGRPPLEPESSAADGPGLDPRFVDAWREWLGKLATDAEAALAAALAYKELDDAGRERWIGALEQDTETLLVPRIAVYAPLLAVETDGARRTRIMDALGPDDASATPRAGAALAAGLALSAAGVFGLAARAVLPAALAGPGPPTLRFFSTTTALVRPWLKLCLTVEVSVFFNDSVFGRLVSSVLLMNLFRFRPVSRYGTLEGALRHRSDVPPNHPAEWRHVSHSRAPRPSPIRRS